MFDFTQQTQLNLFIENGQLHIYTLTTEEVEDLKSLSFSKRLSFSDQTILWLAHKKEWMVLTGDNLIRKWCTGHSLEVLYLFEYFFKETKARV